MSRVIFQISDSGAFAEPANGLELLPTNYDTSQRGRYNVVKIAGRKGGVSQYMGIDRKQFSIGGIFLGDAESMSTKRLALENLIWNEDSDLRGRSVSMSIIYAVGSSATVFNPPLQIPTDSGLETWSGDEDLTYWTEDSESGTWSKDTGYEGDWCAKYMTTYSIGSPEINQKSLSCDGGAPFTTSFYGKTNKSSDPWYTSNIEWYDSGHVWIYQESIGTITTTDWEQITKVGTAPSNAAYYNIRLGPNRSSGGPTVSTWIDNFQIIWDDGGVVGYTESQNINIKGYNISQRRGAKNIYDVSIDMEEEY